MENRNQQPNAGPAGSEILDPVNLRKLSGDSVLANLEYSYRLFCSKRHLHYVVQLTGLVFSVGSLLSLLLPSVCLFSTSIALLCFAWYYVLRPKVVARASARVFANIRARTKNPRNRAAVYVAETGFYLKSGRAILGLYLDDNEVVEGWEQHHHQLIFLISRCSAYIPCSYLSRSYLTEYGRVLITNQELATYHRYDKRWLKTLCWSRVHVDGNPDLPENGGHKGLAEYHCLGSIANHSKEHANCDYEKLEFTAETNSFYPNDPGVTTSETILLIAKTKIRRHHQILTNYVLGVENLLIYFGNESLCHCIKDFYRYQLQELDCKLVNWKLPDCTPDCTKTPRLPNHRSLHLLDT